MLLRSVITTNPKHGPGWIAAARLEEDARNIVEARKLILQGCEAASDSEDVWLEAARLATPENASIVLANAVRHVPHSVKVWLRAMDLEKNKQSKRLVLRRALELIPTSVKLWKAAVELESEADARTMLQRAVECVPSSVDLWLALARLETYENAKKVLNDARRAIPTEPTIWIYAARLEEAQGNDDNVDNIISNMVKSMQVQHVVIDREQWLQHAEQAEVAGSPVTCGAIVRATIGLGVDTEDRKRTWIEDAKTFEDKGRIVCARAVYAHTLLQFPNKKGIWRRAAELEKRHGTAESLEALLLDAVKNCPHAEVLWLMAAKEKWLSGDVPAARAVLKEAFAANPNSENVSHGSN